MRKSEFMQRAVAALMPSIMDRLPASGMTLPGVQGPQAARLAGEIAEAAAAELERRAYSFDAEATTEIGRREA